MAGEWRVVRLADAPVQIIDGDRGQNYPKQSDFLEQGYCLFLNAGNVTVQGFNFSQCQYVTAEKDRALRKGKLERNDVVLTTRGTVGNVAFYDHYVPFDHIRINSGMVIFRADAGQLSPLFLYQILRSKVFTTQVAALRTGSAQPQLPIRDINRIRIPIPPLPEQRAIAHILGSLDDKIELNRKMNTTLEALARALFKSWFVDFDPVYAKANGESPVGMDAATAALFPDDFEESALGLIPKGWRAGTLKEIAENPRRGVHPENVAPDSPYIGLEHMPQRSIALTEWGEAQEVSSNKYAFKKRELLFGKLRPYFHKVGIAPFDGVCSTDILVVVPKTRDWYGLVLGYISSVEFVEYTTAVSGGTRMPRTNWHDMGRYQIVIPPQNVVAAFNQLIAPLVEIIQSNIFQSRTLADLRDTLLPKLISGEVRMPEAERFVEDNI